MLCGMHRPRRAAARRRKHVCAAAQDLLWRRRVENERALVTRYEEEREISEMPWTPEQVQLLVSVMKRHRCVDGRAVTRPAAAARLTDCAGAPRVVGSGRDEGVGPDFERICNPELLHRLGTRTRAQVRHKWRKLEEAPDRFDAPAAHAVRAGRAGRRGRGGGGSGGGDARASFVTA